MSGNKKKWSKTEKLRKNMEKSNSKESDFSENEIPDLNSLKPLEFEPKQTSEILTVVAVMRKKALNIK